MKSGLRLLNDDNFSLQLVTGAASEAHQGVDGGSPWEPQPSDSRWESLKLEKMNEKWIASSK